MDYLSPVKGRRWGLRESSLLLAFVFAFPLVSWSQEESPFAPGVKVLAAMTDLGSRGDAWSPDGQRLAYVTADGIWVVEAPDFDPPRRLIQKESGEHHPITQIEWSPDGQQLAFSSSRPGDSWDTIWVAHADGTQVRDLLPPGLPPHSPGVRSVRISTWLSNQKIAFVHHCGTECVGLSTIDEQTGSSLQPRHIAIAAGSIYWSPAKNLAVTEEHLGGLGLIDARLPGFPLAELSSYSPRPAVLEGCASRIPPWQGPEYYFNDWSPDGRQVLYTRAGFCESQSSVPAENRLALYLWEVESEQQKKLVPNAGWATWSPDGSQIAFLFVGEPAYDSADPSRPIIDTGFVASRPFQLSLGILTVATRAVSTLVPLGLHERLEGELTRPNRFRPLWSPDGHRLIVPHSNGDLVLIQADGSGWQPLTREMPATARWAPDGKRLALWRVDAGKALGQGSELERFLPPIGQEDAALSDADVIDHYFQQALANKPTPRAAPWAALGVPLQGVGKRNKTAGKLRRSGLRYYKPVEARE